MKQANWIMNTNKVRTWAESQEPCDEIQAIMLSLTLGDNAQSDELRSTYWTAIRSIGSTKDGFPTARRGRESNLTEEQQMTVDNVNQTVVNAFAAIPTEYHDTLLTVIVPHVCAPSSRSIPLDYGTVLLLPIELLCYHLYQFHLASIHIQIATKPYPYLHCLQPL